MFISKSLIRLTNKRNPKPTETTPLSIELKLFDNNIYSKETSKRPKKENEAAISNLNIIN